MPDYAPIWPGPALLVPITLDALLVGTPNQVAGALWAQTGVQYGVLSQASPGVVPFTPKTPPAVGAHLLWSLPFAVRHGRQATTGENAGAVNFPLVPNRWAILRSYVPAANGQPGAAAPTLKVTILSSDVLGDLGDSDSPYPLPPGSVSSIGQATDLQSWDGSAGAAPFLQAAGPGDVSWSAAYDNIKNVFAFHDDLSAEPVGFYTYSVAGWYSDPAADPLSPPAAAPWTDAATWTAVMAALGWGVGPDSDHALPASAITTAQTAWTGWQTAHGLAGNGFDAANIDPALVPGQLSALMGKWGAYQSAHGSSTVADAQLKWPAQTLCHGAVLKVQWQGSGYGYPSGAPTSGIDGPSVAIGNTPGEAVAAWMADWINTVSGHTDSDQLETALEAFQKGIVFDLDAKPAETAAALHQARFGAENGGSHWIVVRPEQKPAGEGDGERDLGTGGGGNPGMPLDAAQTAALQSLNTAQAAADSANAEAARWQWELWALYYKLWYLSDPGSPAATTIQAALVTLAGADAINNGGAIAGLLGGARQAAVQTAAATDAARAILATALAAHEQTTGFVVKKINNADFWSPADPVVLVAGARADTKHAPPSTYGSNGFLFTRFTGQTLNAITISQPQGPSNSVTLGVADLQAALRLPGAAGGPAALGIPKELPDLWLETLLIDQAASSWLAQLFATKYQTLYGAASPLTPAQAQAMIAAQQSALWNDAAQLGTTRAALAAAAGFAGVPPDVIAMEDGSIQPWSPLYMDWEAEWHPSLLDEQGFPQDWKLQELDYEWQGASIPDAACKYQGRTTVNPLISQTLTQQLSNFVVTDPDFRSLPVWVQTDLQAVQTNIQLFDFITQSLSGFTEQLITRLPTPSQQVPSGYFGDTANPQIAQLVGSAQTLQPVIADAEGNPPPYWPVRAGHFRLTRLWMVDAYGQVLNPRATNDDCVHFTAAAPVLTPGGSAFADYAQLPPRFTQPARLNFTLIQAGDDALASNSADASSPICGWVIPQHLDDSLLVYDAAGNSLGSMLPINRDAGQTGLRWESVPGSDAPLGSPPALPNKHLQSFVTALLRQGANGTDAFRSLLDAIDAASWQIQPQGQNAQSNLAVLAGNPIALVRARVNIDLQGDPALAFDQDLTQTGTIYPPNPPPAFVTTPFSVRIGDDSFTANGVTGYFAGDDYGKFFAVGEDPGVTADIRRALAAGRDPAPALARMASGERSVTATATATASYVVPNQPLSLAPKTQEDGEFADASAYLTILAHPALRIPVVAGAFPVQYGDLPVGPVSAALQNMSLSFRTGPVLLDPAQVRMPLPSEIHGKWSWMERQSVSQWAASQEIKPVSDVAGLPASPPHLREGWLILGQAETSR